MAIVVDQFSAEFSRTPFTKLPDTLRNQTNSPRAMVNFVVTQGVLSAKPLDDEQTLAVSVILPLEFAYRAMDVNMVIAQDVASSWNARPFLEVTNAIRGTAVGTTQFWPMILEAGQTGQASGSVEMLRPNIRGLPQHLFQSITPGVAPAITMKAANTQAAAGAAGTLQFLLTFLEYEIEQSWNANMFWPTQVYTRN